jgi:hypothetical protein
MGRWLLLFLNGVATAGVALWSRSEHETNRAELSALRRRLREIESAERAERPPAALEWRLSELARVTSTRETPTDVQNEPDTHAVVADDVEQPSDQELLLALDSAFEAEPADRAFQHREERRLTETLTGVLASRDRLSPVECAATMCRTRVSLVNESAFQDFVARFSALPPFWTGGCTLRREESAGAAGIELWLYFATESATLPGSLGSPT